MTALTVTIYRNKILKDGRTRIRIALRHKRSTAYIGTRFIVNEKNFKNGRVIRHPEAGKINTALTELLNTYQSRLDEIRNPEMYTCQQVKEMITCKSLEELSTWKNITDDFVQQLLSENRKSYALLIERNGTKNGRQQHCCNRCNKRCTNKSNSSFNNTERKTKSSIYGK